MNTQYQYQPQKVLNIQYQYCHFWKKYWILYSILYSIVLNTWNIQYLKVWFQDICIICISLFIIILQQSIRSGAHYVRRRQEKSSTILVSIVLVFFICHIHRLAFRIYDMALPESSVYEQFVYCKNQGRYHVPVVIYFLTYIYILFLDINSSINFVIYCCMGRHFRCKLKEKLFLR